MRGAGCRGLVGRLAKGGKCCRSESSLRSCWVGRPQPAGTRSQASFSCKSLVHPPSGTLGRSPEPQPCAGSSMTLCWSLESCGQVLSARRLAAAGAHLEREQKPSHSEVALRRVGARAPKGKHVLLSLCLVDSRYFFSLLSQMPGKGSRWEESGMGFRVTEAWTRISFWPFAMAGW